MEGDDRAFGTEGAGLVAIAVGAVVGTILAIVAIDHVDQHAHVANWVVEHSGAVGADGN